MSSELSRRSVFRAIGLGATAVAVPSLISACGDGSGGGGVGNAGTEQAAWPTYTAAKVPAPDLPGDGNDVQNGYTKYPSQVGTATNGKPGDGSVVKAVVITYGTPPGPKETNKFLQAVNEALGIDLQLTVVPDADYQAKMATLMAGDDLPDIMNIGGGYILPREADFVASKCADLSEYLSGDAVKAYPNLANIPTRAWKDMGRVKGRIMGVPVERPAPGNIFFANREMWKGVGVDDKAFSAGGWTSTDLLTAAKALTKDKKYALGASKSGNFGLGVHAPAWGAPNLWKNDGGTFSSYFTTPEFKQAVAFMRDLFAAGVYYPDALTVSQVDAKTHFAGQITGSLTDGFGAYSQMVTSAKGAYTVAPALPYAGGSAGGKIFAARSVFGYTVLKKAAPERIKLLLRVLDFLAAPFGTKEYELVHYGVEGTHFTRDAAGNPVQTDLWKGGENKTNLPITYLCDAPQVLFYPGVSPEAIALMHSFEQKTAPNLVRNPAYGLVSDTASKSEAAIRKTITDVLNSVVMGRASLDDWDAAVKRYKADGGDKIGEEYGKEYAASK
ncbi:MAG: extracellular solute-binding protein [Hamadaea sp.]|uniref:extracellular solute-binding protein n=1 Tax=Hamadaea sp. TaxID=2024425 RepID=UPI00185BB5D9|nr:extracellular solute-binding protein [Hamadaea sp.]NUT21169.1 extracellular solute-binding protein [Hamadaea sp.]